MKRFQKAWLIFLTVSLVAASLHTVAWGEEKWGKDDPIRDEWNMIDLIIARPMGVAAGIIGTAVFIVSLPFTIPTKSVHEAGRMLVVQPFKFSFVREFPDESF
jgi:hypothetical protein